MLIPGGRRGAFGAGIALAVGAALCFGVLGAGAAKPKVGSSVVLKTRQAEPEFIFRGSVNSKKAACERNRKVRITAGNFPPPRGGLDHEGTVKTNSKGRYWLAVTAADNSLGHYRAIALRKVTRKVVCKVARSPIKPF